MTTEVVETTKKEWQLLVSDRCDSKDCGAQAYVKVVGTVGELLFCSHHYGRIVMDVVGNDRLQNFAYQIIDERDRLIENRLLDD
jgi:hypothetical protein